MSETWLPTLETPDPQSGYDLAILLSRMAVKKPNLTLQCVIKYAMSMRRMRMH